MSKYLIAILTIALVTIVVVWGMRGKSSQVTTQPVKEIQTIVAKKSPETLQQVTNIYEPVKYFKQRVTKKPFGIFITPQTSPIQPERFRGYHTGADAEYSDITTTVPVHATQNGTVVYSGYVSGYGGVIVLTGNINNQTVRFLYGHLNPSQLLPINTTVSAGQQIGILGKGYSKETDFERRHLHFAIIKGTKIDFRGYVQDKNELVKWLDPLLLNYQTLK